MTKPEAGTLDSMKKDATTDSAPLGGAFSVIRREMALLVLLARATPAAIVATEHRDDLRLWTEQETLETLFDVHLVLQSRQ